MLNKNELLAKANKPAEEALRLHPFYRGKIQTALKCPIRDYDDFALWYTPGVAAPCKAIRADANLVYEYTNKANSVAIVSDGTRVLGLGDIGPQAGLPVMEGKALLFKYLGGIDAVPLCVKSDSPDDLIRTVEAIEPTFGGINLEDIAQPKCFQILDTLRTTVRIPVWHDDQQGSATVLLAGLLNALRVVDKRIDNIKIAMIGMGAANVATYRLLKASGVNPRAIVACDRNGTLHNERSDLKALHDSYPEKWRVCLETNEDKVRGGIMEALRGADVCVAFSSPGPEVISPKAVGGMAAEAIVFACANPIPEIWPWDAQEAGALIVATGRSDFPNQVNNSLGFPGIFRGALDIRARTITDEMAVAAANELAQCAEQQGLSEQNIVPKMDQPELVSRVAVTVAMKAQEQEVAQLSKTPEQLFQEASAAISRAQDATRLLTQAGVIPAHAANSIRLDRQSLDAVAKICL